MIAKAAKGRETTLNSLLWFKKADTAIDPLLKSLQKYQGNDI